MNYLAHVFLAGTAPEAILGALLGDFVKGRAALARYSLGVQAGISLHRQIDRFTDAHPAVQASRQLISSTRRRYAGILVDVYYDHFLARHWARYAPMPLAGFTKSVYAVLWRQHAQLPERLQRLLPYMSADDWLGAYADVTAVSTAIDGIARRFRRSTTLAGGGHELAEQYPRFEQLFVEFFPAVTRFVAECGTAPSPLTAAA